MIMSTSANISGLAPKGLAKISGIMTQRVEFHQVTTTKLYRI